MPTIEFLKSDKKIKADPGKSLMQNLLDHQIPVASSCQGDGVCTKCIIHIIEGSDQLSAINEREAQLRREHEIPESHRVSCQTYVKGQIKVDTPYW